MDGASARVSRALVARSVPGSDPSPKTGTLAAPNIAASPKSPSKIGGVPAVSRRG